MKKQEQKFQTLFNHWLKSVFLKDNWGGFAFELKDSRDKDYINFNELADHQAEALMAVRENGLVYKISDSGLGQKPFDSFAMKNCPAFVVIKYPKSFEIISIDNFLHEKEHSKRKSLTSERAKAISVKSVKLSSSKKS